MNGHLSRPLLPVITGVVFVLALCIILLPLRSQTNADAEFVAPKKPNPKIETTQVEKPPAYEITGVVAQAFKTKNPFQLINPFAKKKYGTGHAGVSWDPDHPEKPKGVILFGILW